MRLTGDAAAKYQRGMNFRRLPVLLWVFAIYTAIGVFFALHQYLDDPRHMGGSLAVRFYEEMTGSYSAMVLVPLMSWLSFRAPFVRNNRIRATALNVLGALCYTALHTTINGALRIALGPLVGVHFGVDDVLYMYKAELPSDIIYYGMIMASIYLINHFIATHDLEAKLAEAKLENLRLQIQPHFLFNTLNAISTVMYEDVERADAMLTKLSDFLRTVLDSGSVHVVPLDEELAVERMYVDIMTTRLERSLNLSVNVAPEATDSTVPFMLLQPLLENSIRHGMGSARTSLDLTISVSRSNGVTVIHVDDDGLGFDTEARRGIGLQNVGSRLAYMYPDESTFTIAARPEGGTRATLTFPFQAKEH